jgi:ElaB/YqjD/DUF883 family membrane-anchored ribosome-binding protein
MEQTAIKARMKGGEMSEKAGETMSHMADEAKEHAGNMADKAEAGLDKAREMTADTAENIANDLKKEGVEVKEETKESGDHTA